MQLCGKNVFYLCDQYIMSIKKCDMRVADSCKFDYYSENVTSENVSECLGGNFNCRILLNLLKRQPDKVCGYLFKEKKSKEVIGFIWLLKKGGKDPQYKLKNASFFYFDVFVSEKNRGNGFVGVMMSHVAEKVAAGDTDDFLLAVNKRNESAIKAYKKIGFHIVANKKFVRFLRINIPYHTL